MRPATGIRVGKTKRKGRGVFATKEFLPGDLIERAPVVIVDDPSDIDAIEPTLLGSYWYQAGIKSCALALGYSSLFNHSSRSNADYTVREEEKIIDVTAVRLIRRGAEITINYNGDPNSRRKILFKSKTRDTLKGLDLKIHYIDKGDWGEDTWVWCGTYGVPWSSVPGLVTCKKCQKFMKDERHKLMLWQPNGPEPVPRHELLRLMEQAAQILDELNDFHSVPVREAIRVMKKRYR